MTSKDREISRKITTAMARRNNDLMTVNLLMLVHDKWDVNEIPMDDLIKLNQLCYDIAAIYMIKEGLGKDDYENVKKVSWEYNLELQTTARVDIKEQLRLLILTLNSIPPKNHFQFAVTFIAIGEAITELLNLHHINFVIQPRMIAGEIHPEIASSLLILKFGSRAAMINLITPHPHLGVKPNEFNRMMRKLKQNPSTAFELNNENTLYTGYSHTDRLAYYLCHHALKSAFGDEYLVPLISSLEKLEIIEGVGDASRYEVRTSLIDYPNILLKLLTKCTPKDADITKQEYKINFKLKTFS